MRRLLTEPAAYASSVIGGLRRGWDAFFFTPADPTPLGLIRILVGVLGFWSLAALAPDLRATLGSSGWVDPTSVRDVYLNQGRSWAWSFWPSVPDALLTPAWVACLAVMALLAAGVGSRVTAVLAWAILTATARRAPMMMHGFDDTLSTWAFYLALSGAGGKAASLDRMWGRFRAARAEVSRRRKDGRWVVAPGVPEPSTAANIALRLIQLHVTLIYGMAGLAKLQGGAWWAGWSSWSLASSAEFRLFDMSWLADYPLLINALTHAGLVAELGLPLLLWNRATRPLGIATAFAMHASIGLMLGLGEFGVAMLAGCLAFASGPWLRSLVLGRVEPAGRVLYDGACPRCRASMALFAAADPGRLVEPVDLTAVDVTKIHPGLTKAACLEAMHLVRADGTVDAGYDAVMTLARWLPAFWPLGAVGFVPGMAPIGRRVYNRVAASRPRDCTDDTCGLHPPPRAGREATATAPAEAGRRT